MDGVHAEGQEVAGLELRGEPAPAEFLAERHGVVGEMPVVFPAVVTGMFVQLVSTSEFK